MALLNKDFYAPEKFKDYFETLPTSRFKYLQDQWKYPEGELFPGPIAMQKEFPFLYQTPANDKSEDGLYRFCVGDSQEMYEKNLKKQPKDWEYREKDILYNLNYNGYRVPVSWDKVDWENTVLVFGCSCVFGVGLQEHDTLPNQLALEYGGSFLNMGYPGGSNLHTLYNIMMLTKHFPKPRGIIVSLTTSDRTISWERERLYSIGPWDVNKYPLEETIINDENKTQMYLSRYLSPFNEIGENYLVGMMIRRFLEEALIPHYIFSWFQGSAHSGRCDYIDLMSPQCQKARDIMHPGASVMTETAKHIKKKFIL